MSSFKLKIQKRKIQMGQRTEFLFLRLKAAFRRCGRGHEVSALGSLILVDFYFAGLGTAAYYGKRQGGGLPEAAGPGAWGSRSTLAPGLAGRWVGGRPGNSRPGEGWLRALLVSEATHGGRGKAAAGTGLWPP